MKRIKILHIINSLNAGGAETQFVRLLKNMPNDQFENVIISLFSKGDFSFELSNLGYKIYHLNLNRFSFMYLIKIGFVVRILNQEKPNLVQTWLYRSDLIGTVAAKIIKKYPLLWNIRNGDINTNSDSILRKFILDILSRLSHLPDIIISNCKSGIIFHKNIGYQARKWVYIPDGFDVDNFKPNPRACAKIRQELDIGKDEFVVGLVARYHEMKDHANFIQAAIQILATRNIKIRFILAGKNITAENIELVKRIDNIYLQNFSFLGQRSDVNFLFAAMDVAVLSSKYGEGFPNVLGEAMACGVPCVATDVGDSKNIIGGAGIIVPPEDPLALSSGILKLLNSKKRKMISTQARQRVVENFSMPKLANGYIKIYKTYR